MAQAGKVLVSLVAEDQDFQRLEGEDARAAGARVGLEVELVWANGDPLTQSQRVLQAVAGPADRRPVAVVIEPASATGLDAAGRAALQHGVGWVVLGDRPQPLEGLGREFPDRLVASVGTDNDAVGRLQAQLFRALLPAGGGVLYVEGPSFSAPAIHRRQRLQEGLAGSGIALVQVLSGDWSARSAELAVARWLRPGTTPRRPDLIGAQNDEMALGVRRAFQALRPEWLALPFTGVDGLPEGGQRMVRGGELAATIVTPPPTGPGVELVFRHLRGEAVPPFTLLAPHPLPALPALRPAADRPT